MNRETDLVGFGRSGEAFAPPFPDPGNPWLLGSVRIRIRCLVVFGSPKSPGRGAVDFVPRNNRVLCWTLAETRLIFVATILGYGEHEWSESSDRCRELKGSYKRNFRCCSSRLCLVRPDLVHSVSLFLDFCVTLHNSVRSQRFFWVFGLQVWRLDRKKNQLFFLFETPRPFLLSRFSFKTPSGHEDRVATRIHSQSEAKERCFCWAQLDVLS